MLYLHKRRRSHHHHVSTPPHWVEYRCRLPRGRGPVAAFSVLPSPPFRGATPASPAEFDDDRARSSTRLPAGALPALPRASDQVAATRIRANAYSFSTTDRRAARASCCVESPHPGSRRARVIKQLEFHVTFAHRPCCRRRAPTPNTRAPRARGPSYFPHTRARPTAARPGPRAPSS